MHMVIRALVYANNEAEALERGRGVFSDLVEQGIFDYFVTFDEEGRSVSGKDRWGNFPVAVRADTEIGMKLIREGLAATWSGFLENIRYIQNYIENVAIEDIFEEKKRDDFERFGVGFQFACYCIGRYQGPDVWLYDQDGEGIRNTRHLMDVLERWKSIYEDLTDDEAQRLSPWDNERGRKKENPYRDRDIWVVPADVHY